MKAIKLIRSFCVLTFCLATGAVVSAEAPPRGSANDSTKALSTEDKSTEPVFQGVIEVTSQRPKKLPPKDEELLKSMPLRTKIGQLLMIGFNGQSLGEGLEEALTAIKPGGLIVFGRNIKTARQISDLNLNAQRIAIQSSGTPLLIAVDQEGGNVVRLKTRVPLPSALAFGDLNDTSVTERAGEATGLLLKTLGFNMNLAPVLDVGDPNRKTFIGTRAFGSDPDLVAKNAIRFASGLQKTGILPTAKHFPGHSDLAEDTHLAAPAKTASYEQLRKNDLAPYYQMTKESTLPWAVMVAHIAYPSLDPSGLPASLSKKILGDHLRKRIGFDGIILTDDIEMAGAVTVSDVAERALLALEAGADMIMVAWNKRLQARVTDAIYHAVKDGRLNEAKIDESVRRILLAKRQFAQPVLNPPSKDAVRLALRNPAFIHVANAVIDSRMSRVAGAAAFKTRSIQDDLDKPIYVFSASTRFYKTFKMMLGGRRTKFYRLSADQTLDINGVMRANPEAGAVFYVSGQKVAAIASKITENIAKRILVVNAETQGLLANPQWFAHVADVYYRHPMLGKLTAEHFFKTSLRSPAAQSSPAEVTQSVSTPESSNTSAPKTGAM
jgi:beta-N-acetylhexosaminidase